MTKNEAIEYIRMTPEDLTVAHVEALLNGASSAGDGDTARDCAEWLMCDSRHTANRSDAAARICDVINSARAAAGAGTEI